MTARAKILELPEQAQLLVGAGQIPVSAIDSLLTHQHGLAGAHRGAGQRRSSRATSRGTDLRGNLGWALGRAMGHAPKGTFAAYLNTLSTREIEPLKLGKRVDGAARAGRRRSTRQLDQYAYGLPTIRFTEEHVDQARAAGVLIELDGCRRRSSSTGRSTASWPRRRSSNTVAELEERKQRKAEQQTQLRAESAARPKTPRDELDVEHRAQAREFARRAHGVNLDLGAALLNGLLHRRPGRHGRRAVLRAAGLLGPERSNHLGSADNVARTLAANGIRLVLDEFRTTETPTLKSGKPGKTKVTYGEVDDAQAWLWKFVNGRQDRRRALRPRARRLRRPALRAADRAAQQPAPRRRRARLAEGHREEGAGEAGQAGAARHLQAAHARDRARGDRLPQVHRGPRAEGTRGP